jgi:hypothetical protein
MLLPGNAAAVTSRITLCCHLYSLFSHFCKMAATTADSSIGKKVNYYTTMLYWWSAGCYTSPPLGRLAHKEDIVANLDLNCYLLPTARFFLLQNAGSGYHGTNISVHWGHLCYVLLFVVPIIHEWLGWASRPSYAGCRLMCGRCLLS